MLGFTGLAAPTWLYRSDFVALFAAPNLSAG